MESEKREHLRLKISFPVGCRMVDEKKPFYTVFKDISCGGIKLITDNFMKKSAKVRIEINLIDQVVKGLGEIRWCKQRAYSDTFLAGIKFIDLQPQGESILNNFLSQINPS